MIETGSKADPAVQAVPAAVTPPFALLVMCVECGQGVEAPLPIDRDALALFLAKVAWHACVLTPPNQGSEVPILLGALCASCAAQSFPPEVMRSAEERRQQLLRGAR